jgi:hypothetical protein
MPDNPLENTAEREERVRKRAYHLWESDGRPHGQDREYWERAEFLIGIEDSPGAGQLPNPLTKPDDLGGTVVGEADVGEAEIQEDRREIPDRPTEPGERRRTQKTRARVRKDNASGTRNSVS